VLTGPVLTVALVTRALIHVCNGEFNSGFSTVAPVAQTHMAAMNGLISVAVRALDARRVMSAISKDPEAPASRDSKNGETPLHLLAGASSSKSASQDAVLTITRSLLDGGSKLDAKDAHGRTALVAVSM